MTRSISDYTRPFQERGDVDGAFQFRLHGRRRRGFAALFPAGAAMNRRHQSAMAIFLLNLLLGWTALGWIAALIWSFTGVRPDLRRN